MACPYFLQYARTLHILSFVVAAENFQPLLQRRYFGNTSNKHIVCVLYPNAQYIFSS
jgi:hypothetical protein